MVATIRAVRIAAVAVLLGLLAAPQSARAGGAACPGDCNGDGRVTIGEVVTVVRMNLGELPASACPNGVREFPLPDTTDVVCALRNALSSMCQSC